MPKHNILYRFIHKTIDLAHENGLKFSAKVNSNNTPYYLIVLPINKNSTMIFGDLTYTIEEQHISIYESMIDESQYHYTAILSTKQGSKYRLHVYFNEKDKLSNKPYLDSLSNNDRVEVPLTDAQQNTVIDQADEECQTTIITLRRQHGNFIAELDKRYTRSVMQLEALSKNLRQNYDAYVRESEATKQILGELCLYHTGQEYRNILRLIKRTVPMLKPEPKQIAPQAQKPAIEKVQNSNLSSQHEESVTTAKQKQPSQQQEHPLQKATLANHIEILEIAWKKFIEAYGSDSQNSIKQFLSFNTQLNSICGEEMDGNLDCSASAMQRLEFMMMVRTEYAKKLLTELLLKNDFVKAESLKGFVPLLQKCLLNISLSLGNPELLDFLLTHGDFALNTHEVVDGLSPVPYCLAKCSGKTPLVRCFEILIQHGASLMVRHQGLPVAYHILAPANHPLRLALINKAKVTIASKEFLGMLIRECESCLAQGQDEFINKQKILQFIIKVQNDLKRLNVMGKSAAQQINRDEKILIVFCEKMGKQLSEELSKNPSIIECKEQYYSALAEYKKYASSTEYRAVVKEKNDAIADYTKIVDIIAKLNLETMDLLNLTLDRFKKATRIIELKTELIRVNAEIKKPSNKQNSKVSQLTKSAKELAQEINALIKEHNQNLLTLETLTKVHREFQKLMSEVHDTLQSAEDVLKEVSLDPSAHKVAADKPTTEMSSEQTISLNASVLNGGQ